jgi:hypothetical protein
VTGMAAQPALLLCSVTCGSGEVPCAVSHLCWRGMGQAGRVLGVCRQGVCWACAGRVQAGRALGAAVEAEWAEPVW